MPISLSSRVIVGFSAALIGLALVSVAAYQSIHRFTDDSQWVVHSMEVLGELYRIDNQIAQAKAYERGFVLSPSDLFFKRYADAKGNLLLDSGASAV